MSYHDTLVGHARIRKRKCQYLLMDTPVSTYGDGRILLWKRSYPLVGTRITPRGNEDFSCRN